MKVLFLDESGDHSLNVSKIDKSYPMFVLAGCIFDFDYYLNVVEKRIRDLKVQYFGKTDVILRSYDIRKQKGDFVSLVDASKRMQFYEDLNTVLGGFEFTVIAAAINKLEHIEQYVTPENPYNLCFRFLLERAIMYLGHSTEHMILRAESREGHNDKQLATVYERFRQNGFAEFIKPDEVQRKLVDLSFNQKSQNVMGHQIADLVAYPIGRWVLDGTRENKPFAMIEQKLHRKNDSYLNFGLKIFPDKTQKRAQESPSPSFAD